MHIIQLYHPVILYHTIYIYALVLLLDVYSLNFTSGIWLATLTQDLDLLPTKFKVQRTRPHIWGSPWPAKSSPLAQHWFPWSCPEPCVTGHYEFQGSLGSPGSPGSPHSNGLFLFCQSWSPQEGTQTQSRDAWPTHTVPQNSTKRLFSLDSAAHHAHPSKLNKSEQVTFLGGNQAIINPLIVINYSIL